MVSTQDLGRILLLEGMPDELLAAMAPHVDPREVAQGEVIFEQGALARVFYMVKRGKVLMEVEVAEGIIISLGAVKSGYAFGWSSLLPNAVHMTYAVTAEPCEVLAIEGSRFVELLDRHPASGYVVMRRVFEVFKRRLDRRTGQFLRVMQRHPDIQKLLGL